MQKTIDEYLRAMLVVFEHPDGSEGAMLTVTLTQDQLVDFLELPDRLRNEENVVFPLRHNTDGRTDFVDWNIDAPETDVPADKEKVVEAYQVERSETPIELELEEYAYQRLREYFERSL